MAQRVRVREITNEEGNRLLRIVRRSSGSVVTWRRAQMVLLSAQGMDVGQIAEVAFTSEDRVRAVLHNFNDDGFDSLYPRHAGGRPPTFSLPERRQIKKMALSRPVDHDPPHLFVLAREKDRGFRIAVFREMLDAFERLARDEFDVTDDAYSDVALPSLAGETRSTPAIGVRRGVAADTGRTESWLTWSCRKNLEPDRNSP